MAPPHQDWFKANVDAGWRSSFNLTGIGVSIRDSSGSLVATVASILNIIFPETLAEIRAILEGIKVASRILLLSRKMENGTGMRIKNSHEDEDGECILDLVPLC
ncbi:uncharacterized protein LOC120067397 [Benincasa hispida]|uniref:uncharacterized protein LOC120067397 n=1 Tax=Benincasa hispida TaxID=102211 RepID=UPI001900D5FE|nr:uncharacterized protein LOC120067397 [Benincasa hispida]